MNDDIQNVTWWIVSGLFTLLIGIAMFTIKDLYRRLKKVEESYERLVEIEIYTKENKKNLEKVLTCVEDISKNCVAHKTIQAIREAKSQP